MNVTLVLAAAFALVGVASMYAGVTRRRVATDPAAYIRELDAGELDDADADAYSQRMRLPFLARILRPLGSGMLDRISALTPRNHVLRTHQKLLLAGRSGTIRAEEFITGQLIATVAGLVTALVSIALLSPSTGKATLLLLILPAAGFLVPASWLSRMVQERKDAIQKDLPDVVDLLAISVEAGVGFEGALEIVCVHFQSPLAEELSRTLKEMELGLPRREALQHLKRRTEVGDLSNLVLALTQADALGMSVGRVLHTQAREMRNKRRQWAREKAAKLPVKILFPLVAFIFPAVLVVILGPAAASIIKALA